MSAPSRPRLSRRKKAVFALITTVAFFGLLEAIFWLAGVRVHSWQRDPWVGFSNHVPLYVTSESSPPTLETASNKQVWFNYQTFPREKKKDTYRIFSLGGSTTYGRPYRDPTSYTGWLRELLPLVDDERDWEVINAGGVSYASYRVAALMEELSQYEPDLFIVYTAHNEFLERRTYANMFDQPNVNRLRFALSRTRTWTVMDRMINGEPSVDDRELLPAEVNERLNHTVGPMDYHRDPKWTANVIKHYALNLARMASIAASCGADIAFITPAANLRDCAPFKSEFTDGLRTEDQDKLLQLLDQGAMLAASNDAKDWNAALAALNKAREIDPQYAEVEYQRGRALMRLKRYDDALKAFDQAVELDVCPLRATNAIHSAITRLPETHPRVQLINFRGNLKALCRTELGHECFGEEYFLDHVHPTIDTHRQLALWIIEGLQRSKLLPPGTIGLNELDRVASELEGQLTSEERGVAMRNLAKVLHWAGKFSEAAPRAEDALEELPNDAESLFILAECHRHAGRFIDSFDAFQQLLKHHPNDSRALLPYGVVLVELNEFEAAKGQLMTGLLDDPDSAFGYHWLGLAHLGLEEYEDAKGALLQADSRSSGDPSTLYYLGVACEGLRQWEQAEKHYRQVIEKSPQHAGTRNRLGWVLVELKRPQEAVKQFQAALDIDPTLREAQENLDFARDIFASEL